MITLHESQHSNKRHGSDRLSAKLPEMVALIEQEWRQERPFMSTHKRTLFRQAHYALGTLNEMQEDAL